MAFRCCLGRGHNGIVTVTGSTTAGVTGGGFGCHCPLDVPVGPVPTAHACVSVLHPDCYVFERISCHVITPRYDGVRFDSVSVMVAAKMSAYQSRRRVLGQDEPVLS